jgi:hypothetical protein
MVGEVCRADGYAGRKGEFLKSWEQIYENKPLVLDIKKGKATEDVVCCHCGMVHRYAYRIKGDKLIVKAKELARSTA